MNLPAETSNPFELSKASNFSDTEVLSYWVDILEDKGGLMSILQPHHITPMLLLGGKGSGKTHLMRYCSAPVQAARHQKSLSNAIRKERFLGVYIPVEAMNIHKFSRKGQNEHALSDIFAMYFELWLASSLLDNLATFLTEEPALVNETEFCSEMPDLFDVELIEQFSSVLAVMHYLDRARKEIDYAINNSSITGGLEGLRITFSHGRLAFGVPKLIAKHFARFESVRILYLIDEAELLSVEQQKFLNTLIRTRKGNATFRIGSRLYGIRTYETLGSGEPNRLDAEFEQIFLDGFLRDQRDEYKKLVNGLITTRLRKLHKCSVSDTSDLASYFERLDRDEQWANATRELARSRDRTNKERPYFKKLKSYIDSAYPQNKGTSDEVVTVLRLDEYPLLEKTSVFLLYKDWPDAYVKLIGLAQNIHDQAIDYVNGGRETSLARNLSYYRSDLIAQIYRDFGHRVPYAGLKTLIELSQGIPRNLLTILKYIYRQSYFANERPFADGIISVTSQSNGVRDSSNWFWEDAQPDSDGAEVREAVEALALLFRNIRFSDCPAECDLCTFSVEPDSLSATSRRVLKLAENWSYLIQRRDGALNKNDRGVSAKYQLGPMLAPKWDLSQHRRGNIELKHELANAIFDREFRDALPKLVSGRIAGMRGPEFKHSSLTNQTGLF